MNESGEQVDRLQNVAPKVAASRQRRAAQIKAQKFRLNALLALLTILILLVIVGVIVRFAGSSASRGDNGARRRQDFARGLNQTVGGGILQNVKAQTTGAASEMLIITADNMTGDDCLMMSQSSIATAARETGFSMLFCERPDGAQWNHLLVSAELSK